MIDKIIYIIVGVFVVYGILIFSLIINVNYREYERNFKGLVQDLWNMEQGKEEDDMQRIGDLRLMEEVLEKNAGHNSNYCLSGQDYCEGKSIDGEGAFLSNGTGWVKVDLAQEDVPILPPDPINLDRFYYRYCSDGKTWELNTRFMSDKYKLQAENDKGDDPARYEIGTNLNICR